MSFKQSFFETIIGLIFDAPAFDRGICRGVFVNHLADSNGAPAIIGSAKLSGACVTDSSALWRTLHGRDFSGTPAMDFVVIRSLKEVENSVLFSWPYPIHCNQEIEILLTLGKMCSFWYNAWYTQVMILQKPVRFSGMELLPPAYVGDRVTEMETMSNVSTPETTGTGMQMEKFDAEYYRRQNQLFRIY